MLVISRQDNELLSYSTLAGSCLDTCLDAHAHLPRACWPPLTAWMCAQDENTRYVCIGPVNKTLNMLAVWLEDPSSEAFKQYVPQLLLSCQHTS